MEDQICFKGWGYREMCLASELLAYFEEHSRPDFIEGDICLGFNSGSGYVYMYGDEGGVGIMENGEIVEFYSCPECGYEGTQWEAVQEGLKNFEDHNGYCSSECEDKNI